MPAGICFEREQGNIVEIVVYILGVAITRFIFQITGLAERMDRDYMSPILMSMLWPFTLPIFSYLAIAENFETIVKLIRRIF